MLVYQRVIGAFVLVAKNDDDKTWERVEWVLRYAAYTSWVIGALYLFLGPLCRWWIQCDAPKR